MLLDIPTPKFGVSSETRGGGAWPPVGAEGAASGEKLLLEDEKLVCKHHSKNSPSLEEEDDLT
jgi:hypothetical protein